MPARIATGSGDPDAIGSGAAGQAQRKSQIVLAAKSKVYWRAREGASYASECYALLSACADMEQKPAEKGNDRRAGGKKKGP
jgi:hypothetical protein